MVLRSQLDVGLTVTPNKARALVESKHAANSIELCLCLGCSDKLLRERGHVKALPK